MAHKVVMTSGTSTVLTGQEVAQQGFLCAGFWESPKQTTHDRLGGSQGMQNPCFLASCGPVSGSAHAS